MFDRSDLFGGCDHAGPVEERLGAFNQAFGPLWKFAERFVLHRLPQCRGDSGRPTCRVQTLPTLPSSFEIAAIESI